MSPGGARRLGAALAVLAAGLALPPAGGAQAGDRPIVVADYVPPMRGAPVGRIGGAHRGMTAPASAPLMEALAPDHVAYATSDQPVLYWYLSRPTTARLQVTVTAVGAATPLLESDLAPPRPGVNAVRLAERGVRLKPGTDYEWSVSTLPEGGSPALAGGMLRVVPMPAGLAAKLAATPREAQADMLAENSLWYDAIDTLSSAVAAKPSDPRLHQQRARLLDQVGLRTVAAYDRQQGGG